MIIVFSLWVMHLFISSIMNHLSQGHDTAMGGGGGHGHEHTGWKVHGLQIRTSQQWSVICQFCIVLPWKFACSSFHSSISCMDSNETFSASAMSKTVYFSRAVVKGNEKIRFNRLQTTQLYLCASTEIPKEMKLHPCTYVDCALRETCAGHANILPLKQKDQTWNLSLLIDLNLTWSSHITSITETAE